jgi:hypothetical protein
MSQSQWTVIGLIILLLGLEVVRSQNVKSFFTGIYANFNTALSSASAPAATGTETPASSTTTTPAKSSPSKYPAFKGPIYGV